MPSVDNSWSSTSLVPTQQQRYLWKFEYIYYSDGSVEVTDPVNLSIAGADADTTGITETLDKTKQELAAKIETVRDESLAAAEEAKQELAAVNTKVDSAKEELTQTKQELTNVANDLSQAKTDLQTAVSEVDTKATNLKSDLTQAKQDLNSQAQQLQAQANAQSELTKRVSSVEKTANGTKTTVGELSKTVAQNGKDITSVTARTKVVEDDLAGTKTTLSQVKTTADSTSQKTATLETGLNGLSAKFDNLKIGGRNLLSKTNQGKTNWAWKVSSGETTAEDYNVDGVNAVKLTRTSNDSFTWHYIQYKGLIRKLIEPNTKYTLSFDVKPSVDVTFSASLQRGDGGAPLTNAASMNKATANQWTKVSCVLTSNTTLSDDLSQVVYLSGMPVAKGNWLVIKNIKLEKGNVATDYSPSDADIESKVAEYKQTADQNYASLQTTVQNLDGTVQHNKTVADQTAQGFSTRIESLETYKDGESERANAYFESAKTETAKQLTAERTAIAKDYVAKSTYTSDVTGIRNDLTATTSTANATKTNLANYQASNDKVVASLKSSLQTTDGNVSNLQTKVEAVPGQITSAVSAVEGKIPTTVGGRNYIRDYGLTATGWISLNSGWKFEIVSDSTAKSGQYFKATCTTASTGSVNGFYKNLFDFSDGRFFGKQMTWAMDVKTSKNTKLTIGCEWGKAQVDVNVTENWQRFSKTFKVASSSSQKAWVFYSSNWNVGDIVYIRDVQLEDGSIATSPVPAIEDTISQISNLSSEIKQTADGMTLLATKTEVNSAKTELQSGINTATDKANNNAQTISTHTTQISALNTGLNAKVSQTDFNTLSGRVTTAENNITAKANELSSKITSVEGKIPTEIGAKNLIIKSTAKTGVRLSANGGELQDQAHSLSDWIKIEPNTTYTLTTYENVDEGGMYYSLAWYSTNSADYSGWISRPTGTATSANLKGGKQYQAPANAKYAKVSYPTKYSKVKLERGKISTDYTSAPEDYDSKLATVQSEFKQTTDSIKASVQSLDNNTVKSSSLTINADGIVMKAGKSTTDVANAIGSYFSVNQNAINLFSDKINVKGSMIVDGAITGDKIKANSVDVSKIVGIDADYIKAKIEYAMIDWLKGKTITAYNDNMTIDLQDGRISFKDGSNAVYRQTPDGIHTGFLHFEAGSQGGIYAAFGATSTRQGINSKSSEFAGIRCYRVSADGDSHDAKVDKIEVIGDAIQFGHGYESDGQIGGGFIMDTAVFGDDTPYSLNRVIKSIEALWRILHDHAKNTGYRFNDSAFINAINNEYNTWHDMHNI